MNRLWDCGIVHSLAGESSWYSNIRDYSITRFGSEMNVEGNMKKVIGTAWPP